MDMQLVNFSVIRRLASTLTLGAFLVSVSGMANAGTIPPWPIGDAFIPDADCALTGPSTGDCVRLDDPSGNTKELGPAQGSDTKLGVIHTAIPPMLGFTNPNGQNDLVKVWLKTGVDGDGDVWLYLAWERDANSGTSVITYEFHGNALDAACDYTGTEQNLINNCNPWANRANGDFLVVYDFQGSSSTIIIRKFDGTTFDAGTDVTLEGTAEAELNGDSSRGEAAINLTDSLFNAVNTCVTVANVIPGTITGNSDTADYKDTLLVDSGNVNISNCGTVKITKTIDPNSLNQDGTFSYTLDREDSSDIRYDGTTSLPGALMDTETDTLIDLIVANNYQISEDSVPANFEKASILCDKPAANTNADADSSAPNTFSVETSATTNCIIKNRALSGKLTVIKEVTNDNGGTAAADDFCYTLGDGTSDEYPTAGTPGTEFEFLPGTSFNVQEVDCAAGTTPPGYSQSYSLSDGQTTTASCSGTIAAGDDLTCTITNDDISPTITVVKTIVNNNGGTITDENAFGLKVDGQVVQHNATNDFDAGAHTVSEDGLAGYAAGTWGGDCNADGSITLALDQDATCTITNDDISPTITVVKTIVNDNGGTITDENAFGLKVDGGAVLHNVKNDFDAGNHTVSEDGLAGYAAGTWGGDCAADGSITLALDQDATCTITNDDISPTITVVKTIVNNNGGQVTDENAFGLKVDGGAVLHNATNDFDAGAHTVSEDGLAGYAAGTWGGDCAADGSITLALDQDATCTITNDDISPTITVVKTIVNDNGGQVTDENAFGLKVDGGAVLHNVKNDFDAGAHTVSEDGLAGYAAGNWGGDCAADGSITLALDQDATCTITNDDISPTITVVKTIVNDNGGTITDENAFGLKVDGQVVQHNATNDFDAGAHTVSEDGLAGYAAGTWGGDCNADGSITLALDQDATCTITNDDQAPSLTLFKSVKNDFGGTATTDAWTLAAAGPTGFSGKDSGSGVGNGASFDAGSYDLSESGGPPGYSGSSWVCTGGTQNDGDTITLGLGQSAVCTITNTQLPQTQVGLTLFKTVVNDNGGGKDSLDWTLSATLKSGSPDACTSSGFSGKDDGQGAGVPGSVSLSDGLYTCIYVLAESPASTPGYTASNWSCNGGGIVRNGSEITIASGGGSCTITNDDNAPSLTLKKAVINNSGGTSPNTAWTLTATGPTGFSGQMADTTTGVSNGASFDAGTYDLSESGPSGYSASSWVCTGSGTQDDGDTITLGLGESAECTITNDDIPPVLHIVKTPDSGVTVGPGGTAQFTITVYNVGGGDALGVTLDDTLPSPAGLGALTWGIVSQSVASACTILGDGVTLDCDNIGNLAKDPTPGNTDPLDTDEASFQVVVSTTIPSDYFDPGTPPNLANVFEIDGDMVQDLGGAADDWDSVTYFDTQDPTLAVITGISKDDSFGKGSKENDAVPSVVDNSVPPNKSDLTHFIGVTDQVVDGNVLLAIGWLRNNELGTSSFDFELNQSSTSSTNGVTPVRTIADWLIGFDFSSGGDNVSLTLREWDGSVWGPVTTLNASVALGAVNDPVTFGTSPNNEDNILPENGKLLDNTFGEAVINLTAAFPGGCRNFASAFVKGRSSDSFTSALKDFIAPVPVDIDTCQTVNLPNTAYADAANQGGPYNVSDTGSIDVSNAPPENGN